MGIIKPIIKQARSIVKTATPIAKKAVSFAKSYQKYHPIVKHAAYTAAKISPRAAKTISTINKYGSPLVKAYKIGKRAYNNPYIKGLLKQNKKSYQRNWQNSYQYKSIHNPTYDSLKQFQNKSYQDGFKQAYSSKHGFVMKNINGRQVMFVRGTRPRLTDWGSNVLDSLPGRIPGYIESRKYDLAARLFKPDIVVGHSRGGYNISRMKYNKQNNKTKYVGFDSAMRLSKGSERNMLNFAQNQPFDKWLGRGGQNNFYYDYDQNRSKFHSIYH